MTFDFIYEKYFDEIYRYCRNRIEGDKCYVEDVTAETFELLFMRWETVKDFHESRLRAWLYGVAKNKIKEMRRDQPPATESLSEERCRALIDEEHLRQNPIDEEEEYQKYAEYINQIRLRLKPKDWNLFRMRVIERLPHKEIGEKLEIGENAAKLRWARLEDKLRPIVAKILKNK